MKHFRYRGKHIRPADKDLVFRSACCVALPVSLAVFALLNLKTILQTGWHRLSMLDVSGLDLNTSYLLFNYCGCGDRWGCTRPAAPSAPGYRAAA